MIPLRPLDNTNLPPKIIIQILLYLPHLSIRQLFRRTPKPSFLLIFFRLDQSLFLFVLQVSLYAWSEVLGLHFLENVLKGG